MTVALRTLAASALLLSTLIYQPSTSFAQGTGFTYQGRLNTNGAPATGSYDLQFSLWNAASGPSQLGGTLTIAATAVSNGLFTVTLDFGAGVFTGDPRWLEIGVATHGGTFAAISPRQALLPTPYAIHASTAAAVVAGSVVRSLNALKDDVTLAAGANVTITPSGNTLIIAGSGGWKLGGNAGTTPGVNFLGTADNQALQLKVNNVIALQLTPGVTVPNVVGGLASIIPTVIGSGVSGAVVAGGNAPSGGVTGFGGGDFQAVYDDDGTIGGGFGNQVGSNDGDPTDAAFATVAGGVFNYATAYGASVGGGDSNVAGGQRAAVGGGYANQAVGATSAVGGGLSNQATGSRSTVGGGHSNLAANTHAAVAGGGWNTASGVSSFIGGGGGDTFGGPWPNTASGNWSAILGGWNNLASGYSSVVGGGGNNISLGTYSVVPGGSGNMASNYCCFAAGFNAHAVHGNSFVWSDGNVFSSTAPNEFAVRANGGVRFATTSTPDSVAACNQFVIGPNGTTNAALRLGFHTYNGISQGGVIQATDGGPQPLELNPMGGGGYLGGNWAASGTICALAFNPCSDRNVKQDFAPVDAQAVLKKVAQLPIQTWTFKDDPHTKHVGPMAQDFYAAFAVGPDDKHIATVDADGVALAALQGLNQKVEDLNAELQRRDTENAALKQRLDRLERLITHENGGAQ